MATLTALVFAALLASACNLTPSTKVPSTTVPSTARPCSTSQLSVTLGRGNGTAGSVYVPLQFRNRGSSACTLHGYPGVSYVTGPGGNQVGRAAQRMGPVGGQSAEAIITLAPGSVAQATLRVIDVSNLPVSSCSTIPVSGLRVDPPGETTPVFVPDATNGCTQSGPLQLGIGFIVQGPMG